MNTEERNIYYVYVYLNPKRPGKYSYGKFQFEYEPLYVGKGANRRAFAFLAKNNHYLLDELSKIGKPIINIPVNKLPEETALSLETSLITLIGRLDLDKGPLYNRSNGGSGVGKGVVFSEEHKRKLSEAKKGKKRPPHSEEHKCKIANSLKGHIVSKETRKKISEKLKNRN